MVVLLLLLLPVRPLPTRGAEFTVNSSYDVNDLEPGNGLCVAYLIVSPPFVFPFCTLRAAIEESNALSGPDTVNISSGTFFLDIEGINEDMAIKGDLDITDSLRIKGEGITKTYINGNRLDRVFDIPNPNIDVHIEHLTITNGFLPSLLTENEQGGGGIRNRGNLSLQNIVLKNNLVNGGTPGDAGGGILNLSNSSMHDSTVEGNQAFTGGGICNSSAGTLSIFTSTINDNEAVAGGGFTNEGVATIVNTTISGNTSNNVTLPFGGGIYNTSELEILQSTITKNTSTGPGGGISSEGNLQFTNTIVAGNTYTNCYHTHPIQSLGSNLDDDNSCLLRSVSDIINADPRLDTLQDHGGPTRTHGLFIGSPAVDNGQDLSSVGITRDQRGMKRPDGEAYDIGAFETRKRTVAPLFVPLLSYGN